MLNTIINLTEWVENDTDNLDSYTLHKVSVYVGGWFEWSAGSKNPYENGVPTTLEQHK